MTTVGKVNALRSHTSLVEERHTLFIKEPVPVITYYLHVKDEHTNFVVESFWGLGFLSDYIHELLENQQNYRYYDVITLRQMAYVAAKEGRLSKDDVKNTQWKIAIKELERE